MINKGVKNEIIFVNYIDNKRVGELNLLFQEMLFDLFENITKDDIVYCTKNQKPEKTDIFITIKNVQKRVSLKIGDKNSVHMEPISEFVNFLIKNNVSREYIILYLKYHYADGTINGKGTNRKSVNEYKKTSQNDINLLNELFNSDKLLYKFIERFVLRGRNSNYDIDLLISGKIDDFFYLKKEDIIKIIYGLKNISTTGLHAGALYIQPQSRNLKNNPKYEKCRYCVQIKWFNLFEHILLYKSNNII
ncbi:MAG TPA: hypothetical protein PLV83_02755 [Bacilli bacterium]|nr:hypothetical protein [Bacilli bacterium]